jgi:hypothetical protein
VFLVYQIRKEVIKVRGNNKGEWELWVWEKF